MHNTLLSQTLPERFTVTQLNQWVKQSLESTFAVVRVIGEISNCSRPMSGHIYFTLKDAYGELRCVLFKTYQHTDYLPLLKDGISIEATGKVTIYYQRGLLQMLVSSLTLQGEGLLKIQFSALKQKLETAGLFAKTQKKHLPLFPKFIGVISSPEAAGLEDFLTIMQGRYPFCHIRIFCSAVQGKYAATQLCQALHSAQLASVDVIVFCRGGGTLEDLWCFNNETLAQAIYHCPIPILSAVGHEKDTTICDLCADVRAATPTNAAMLVAPDSLELYRQLIALKIQLVNIAQKILYTKQLQLRQYVSKILHPKAKIQAYRLMCTQYTYHLSTTIRAHLDRAKNTTQDYVFHLKDRTIAQYVQHLNQVLDTETLALQKIIQQKIHHYQLIINPLISQLHALSPYLVLQRGYALIKKENAIQNTIHTLHPGDHISLSLSDGQISAMITAVSPKKIEINS